MEDAIGDSGFGHVSKEEAAASEKLYLDAKNLADQITEAFKGVTLDDGMSLQEANYLDAPTAEGLQTRHLGERNSWEAVCSDQLRISGLGGFWHLDKLGLKFHLPAFMIADLQGKLECCLPYKLYNRSQQRDDLAGMLDPGQKDAVIAYLNLCLRWDIYENEEPQIGDSLDTFWRRKDNSPSEQATDTR